MSTILYNLFEKNNMAAAAIGLSMKNKRSIVNQPRFIFNLGHSSKDESNVSHDSSSLLILSY